MTDIATRKLPEPQFTSALHDDRTAAWLGIALGVTFSICFATGLWSHIQQNPPSWFDPIARPAGLYRFTQGLHIATGIATIPILLSELERDGRLKPGMKVALVAFGSGFTWGSAYIEW